MSDAKLLICPYCGQTQPTADHCRACGGLFEPLSRQATHNAMGPWFVRDQNRPFQPGCSYDTLVKLIQRGQVTRHTIVRGPTTRQFWTIAARAPGISHHFGACHQCDASVDSSDNACHACGATFGAFLDRNFLGLPEYRPLPWEADATDAPSQRVEYDEPADLPRTPPPAGEPRGLSSFATDEELFGHETRERESAEPDEHATPRDDGSWTASQSAPIAGGSTTNGDERGAESTPSTSRTLAPAALKELPDLEDDVDPSVQSAAPQPIPDARSGPQPTSEASAAQPGAQTESQTSTVPREDPISAAQIRALQRRLAQQQRTKQRLAVAALLAASTAVVALMGWLGGERDAPAPAVPPDEEQHAGNDDVTTDTNRDRVREIDGPDALDDPILDALDGDLPQPATLLDERQPDEDPDGVTEEDQPWNADEVERLLKEAESLLDGARDEDRTLSQRIRDVEDALEKLKQLRDAPAELRPENLDRLIDDARREYERLQLREFFP